MKKPAYYQQQVGRFKDYFAKPPVQEGYEVRHSGLTLSKRDSQQAIMIELQGISCWRKSY